LISRDNRNIFYLDIHIHSYLEGHAGILFLHILLFYNVSEKWTKVECD